MINRQGWSTLEQVLDYAERLGSKPVEDEAERLRNLRDRAFLLALADTGLRVHEADAEATGRDIVEGRAKESLGIAAAGTIAPHSMRHYFVTIVLRASGNLKVAQALARHSNISATSLCAHLTDEELDKVYWETFERD